MPVFSQSRSAPSARPPAPVTLPTISVIVPVRNEAGFIADTLSQLLAQDYPTDRVEILVADGRSTDETRTIVSAITAQYPRVRLLDNPLRLSSAGRNVAVAASGGDIVLLIDGHCQIDNPRYLADLADAFDRSGADSVGRPQPLDVRGATWTQRAIAQARSSFLGHHPASHIYTDREGFVPPQSVAIAYRREVFERIGMFDERFDACEDVEFNHRMGRAGLSCYFTPRATVKYQPRGSLVKLFRQMTRYGRGRVRLLRKHRDTFSLAGFIPALFLIGLVVGPLLASLFDPLWFVYLGSVVVYAFLVCFASLQGAVRSRQPVFLALLPAVFVTVHLGAGWGLCWEAISFQLSAFSQKMRTP